MDLIPCIKLKESNDGEPSGKMSWLNKDFMKTLFSRYYAPTLIRGPTKAAVLLFFILFTATMAYLAQFTTSTYPIGSALPDDSYALQFYSVVRLLPVSHC